LEVTQGGKGSAKVEEEKCPDNWRDSSLDESFEILTMSDTSSIASTSRSGQVPGVSAGAHEPELKGWLHKWTNYLKGYQKRWFILANGTLSYYR